jgi:hypothetical protein
LVQLEIKHTSLSEKERPDPAAGPDPDELDVEPRRPAAFALLAIGLLFMGFPNALTLGGNWLPLAFVLIMFVPMIITRRRGLHDVNHVIAIVVISVITVFMVTSLILGTHAVLNRIEGPGTLLRSASILWIANVLIFAWWYWRLDAGGPHVRGIFDGHRSGAFLFPQMTLSETELTKQRMTGWAPSFVDYLFVAFNTSTALSPTDTPVLSAWAKLLTMLQSIISLSIITFLAARAVGIL